MGFIRLYLQSTTLCGSLFHHDSYYHDTQKIIIKLSFSINKSRPSS